MQLVPEKLQYQDTRFKDENLVPSLAQATDLFPTAPYESKPENTLDGQYNEVMAQLINMFPGLDADDKRKLMDTAMQSRDRILQTSTVPTISQPR